LNRDFHFIVGKFGIHQQIAMADEEKTKVDLRRSWIEKKIQENMRHIKKEKLNKGKIQPQLTVSVGSWMIQLFNLGIQSITSPRHATNALTTNNNILSFFPTKS
tara:strand:+ start:72 stop:383 length:312 start_codon:yes stop_codon:yes gene_type:complete